MDQNNMDQNEINQSDTERGEIGQSQETPYKRRVRYSGTHPKRFHEKYKELNPNQYQEDVEKVIRKGRTPAGMHISICVDEILEVLRIQPGEIGLDVTLGYGGHSQKMLELLDGSGCLYGLDVDSVQLPKTVERLRNLGYDEERFQARNINFRDIDQIAQEVGLFDFVLGDLGVSSMQIDNPDRGFTFKAEGPLDLRLNPMEGITAAERIAQISYMELEAMLIENADEPYASQIAKGILAARKKGGPIETTTQLKDIITQTIKMIPRTNDKDIKKACQRTFQALRIDINQEFDVLDLFLEKLPSILKPGARVAILTFHSGEDRRVKKSFKNYFKEGVYQEIAPDPIRPSAQEINANSRARSAKLRWAIKA